MKTNLSPLYSGYYATKTVGHNVDRRIVVVQEIRAGLKGVIGRPVEMILTTDDAFNLAEAILRSLPAMELGANAARRESLAKIASIANA